LGFVQVIGGSFAKPSRVSKFNTSIMQIKSKC
jgi:hypothetical protein